MSKRTYITVAGDTLQSIAQKVWGEPSKSYLITQNNPGLPTAIRPGTVLKIPRLPEEASTETNPGDLDRDENEIDLLIDDKNFRFWTDFEINFTLDTMDTFAVSAPFDSSLDIYRQTFQPFTYKDIALYIGGKAQIVGTMIDVVPQISNTQASISISGYSKPGVLNDCSIPVSAYPLEFNGVNLQEIAKRIAGVFSLDVVFEADPGPLFERVAIEPDRTPLQSLIELAKQRGLLITNSKEGKLLFFKTNLNSSPVATIKQDDNHFISCVPSFNAQSFYSSITGLTNTKSANPSNSFTLNIPNQNVLRPNTFIAEDIEGENLEAAVRAKAGRMFGDSVSYSLVLSTHRDSSNNIFKKNTIISLEAPSAFIYNETRFLIKNVRLLRNNNTGNTAELTLVFPESYNNEIPAVIPWQI